MAVRIRYVCIDLDNYTTDAKFRRVIAMSERRSKTFGSIMHSKKTKHGWHIKIRLDRIVGFWRSIEIRYYCMDDPARMFYDIMRHRSGGTMIDTCFDQKKTVKRKIKLNKA